MTANGHCATSAWPCVHACLTLHRGPPPPFVQECGAINLANQTGREGKLSSAYREAAERYSAAFSGFRLVPFDFHKQCGATNYGRWGGGRVFMRICRGSPSMGCR